MKIDTIAIKKAANAIRAIDHDLRRKILEALHENQAMTVKEIQEKWSLHQSETSQHLAILRNCRYVITERKGKNVYYSIDYSNLNIAIKLFESF